MKTPPTSRRRGLTLIEVLVVILVVAFLAFMVIPVDRSVPKARRILCVNNLKNIGLALRTFSADHGDKWPMDLSVTNGGSREYLADADDLWKHWRLLAKEWSSPKILLCPADMARQWPEPFWGKPLTPTIDRLTNSLHLSYFLGLNAHEDQQQTILAGDRNLTTNAVAVGSGRLVLTASHRLGFTKELHNHAGNLLFADGSVQQVTSSRLNEAWHDARTNSGLATNVWLVP